MDAGQWSGRLGESWAAEWRRTDLSFKELTHALIERAVALAGDGLAPSVLDIGCGAGSTSFELARHIPGAEILGVDISPALIDVAWERAGHVAGPDDGPGDGGSGAGSGGLSSPAHKAPANAPAIACHFELADASVWSDGDFQPDLLFSRHGVMFFDDPVAAFANLRAASRPGARLIFSCFRSRQENLWLSAVTDLIPGGEEPPQPGAPGPFAFANQSHVRAILESAGWADCSAQAVDFSYISGGGDDPVGETVAFFRRIGPVARAIAGLPEERRDQLMGDLAAMAEKHCVDGQVSFPGAAWIWTAQSG